MKTVWTNIGVGGLMVGLKKKLRFLRNVITLDHKMYSSKHIQQYTRSTVKRAGNKSKRIAK